MDENDIKLIEKANSSKFWEDVCELEKLAHSDEAKEELKYRRMHLYHSEEYSCGIL